MPEMIEKPLFGFTYLPEVGEENWEYAFAAAQVRAAEIELIPRNLFVEMANAADFQAAVDCLSSTEYAAINGSSNAAQIEQVLIESRTVARELFEQLIDNRDIAEIFKARTDFSNLRLALRRLVTEKTIGVDYSVGGNVEPDKFEEALEQENYIEFPLFLQEAVEAAVLKYYENKDIRAIDYGVDGVASEYFVGKSAQLNCQFLLELFRLQADLTNIKTLLRLKLVESIDKSLFVSGGYLDISLLGHCLDMSMDGLAAVFAFSPYQEIIEHGINYFNKKNSFLGLENACASRVYAYLVSANQITAGIQPIAAYLLKKEEEIRTIRMILTGKKNNLSPEMLIERLIHFED